MNTNEAKRTLVKVRHYRNREGLSEPEWYARGYGFVILNDGQPSTFEKMVPAIKGGATRAWTMIGNRIISGWAYCSMSDSFCYALGSTIARGRLRKQLETRVSAARSSSEAGEGENDEHNPAY